MVPDGHAVQRKLFWASFEYMLQKNVSRWAYGPKKAVSSLLRVYASEQWFQMGMWPKESCLSLLWLYASEKWFQMDMRSEESCFEPPSSICFRTMVPDGHATRRKLSRAFFEYSGQSLQVLSFFCAWLTVVKG